MGNRFPESRTSRVIPPPWRATCTGSASIIAWSACGRSICFRRRRMWRRWRYWRRREETTNAERGSRNAEQQEEERSTSDLPLLFLVPRSAFRVWGEGCAVKYFVTIGTTTVEVEVDADRVLVGGEPVDVHLAPLPGTPLYHLLLAGESWTVAAQPLEGDGRWALGVVGERVEVAVRGGRAPGGGAAEGGGGPA